jgi:peroxiredoxin Q/BCP
VGYTYGVGREAPSFSLTDQDGNTITLKQYRGDGMPVIAFFADGAPESVEQVGALSAAAQQLWGMRGQLVGIVAAGADAVTKLAAEAGGAAFPLIADPNATVARAYGAWSAARSAVTPLVCVVDKSGKIVWAGEGASAFVPAAILEAFTLSAR